MADEQYSTLTIEAIKARRSEILSLADRYKAYHVRLFGSIVRGEARETSDIDLLVKFRPDHRIWDHIGLMQDLSDLFGRKVDVVDEDAIKDRLRSIILRESIPL